MKRRGPRLGIRRQAGVALNEIENWDSRLSMIATHSRRDFFHDFPEGSDSCLQSEHEPNSPLRSRSFASPTELAIRTGAFWWSSRTDSTLNKVGHEHSSLLQALHCIALATRFKLIYLITNPNKLASVPKLTETLIEPLIDVSSNSRDWIRWG